MTELPQAPVRRALTEPRLTPFFLWVCGGLGGAQEQGCLRAVSWWSRRDLKLAVFPLPPSPRASGLLFWIQGSPMPAAPTCPSQKPGISLEASLPTTHIEPVTKNGHLYPRTLPRGCLSGPRPHQTVTLDGSDGPFTRPCVPSLPNHSGTAQAGGQGEYTINGLWISQDSKGHNHMTHVSRSPDHPTLSTSSPSGCAHSHLLFSLLCSNLP